MILYWLLFGFAATMAMLFTRDPESTRLGAGHSLAMIGFVLFYTVLATLRFEIGGDWETYDGMYEFARQSTLAETAAITDPLFALILWLSAKAGIGIYAANGVCAFLIVVGTVRLALTTREPWLAIVASVPYLLIVVGMGYVRQAGAIGMVMLAIASIDGARRAGALPRLAAAAMLHVSSVVTALFFLPVLLRGARLPVAIVSAVLAAVAAYLLTSRLGFYQAGYLDQGYDSGGATVRVMMNVVPSLLLLARWKHFSVQGGARIIWLGFALANVAAMVALLLSPSSTAVDRIALYFAPVQLVVFGSLIDLLGVKRGGILPVRALAVGVAASVQVVWLTLATFSYLWVPYRSVFGLY